jgi:hypothetical protein
MLKPFARGYHWPTSAVRHYMLQEFRRDGRASEALSRDISPSFLTQTWSAQIARQFATLAVRRAWRRITQRDRSLGCPS